VLKIAGEEVFTFPQGQFSQDLKPCVESGKVAYGLWLNHKGKVQSDSFVLKRGEAWWCVSLFSEAVALRERLEGYVTSDDVTVEDVTAQWAGVSVLEANASMVQGWAETGGARPAGVGGDCEWLYPVVGESAVALLRARGMEEISSGELERLRVEAGVPAVPHDIGPEDLPNESGLELDAISYAKGCYLGQEVMARLKTMGQVRRRLVRVSGAGAIPGELPAALFVEGKKCGELRSAAAAGEGSVGLAMISLLGMTGNRLLSFSPEGVTNIVVSHEG
jgi:folate-binding protein YgfZ